MTGTKALEKDRGVYYNRTMNTENNKTEKIVKENSYSKLLTDIGELLTRGRKSAEQHINTILVETYWRIGYRIVEFEQKGHEKAEYGSNLLTQLSKDLKLKYGKGFSKSNIYLMRLFYLKYEKFQTVSGKLENRGTVRANVQERCYHLARKKITDKKLRGQVIYFTSHIA